MTTEFTLSMECGDCGYTSVLGDARSNLDVDYNIRGDVEVKAEGYCNGCKSFQSKELYVILSD